MKKIIFLISLLTLAGCTDMIDRIKGVGRPPKFKDMNTYEKEIKEEMHIKRNNGSPPIMDYETAFYSEQQMNSKKTANAIWSSNSRSFFRNRQNRSIGDIIKVSISLSDKATINNKTETKRNNSGVGSTPIALGYGKYINKILPKGSDVSKIVGQSNTDTHSGEGKINRAESLQTSIAATIVKILPSGNFIIKGSQEVRVNHEVRELTLEGIIRPEDVTTENMVDIDQIAEARISYGGRGLISDQQQPKYAKELLDIISPF